MTHFFEETSATNSYILEFPAFPIDLYDLNSSYVKETLLETLGPVMREFSYVPYGQDYGEWLKIRRSSTLRPMQDDVKFQIYFTLIQKPSVMQCVLVYSITQLNNDDVICRVFRYPDCTFEHRRHNLRGVKRMNAAVGKVLNTFIRDARMAVRAPLRNGTDRFLGRAETLVSRFLGYSR